MLSKPAHDVNLMYGNGTPETWNEFSLPSTTDATADVGVAIAVNVMVPFRKLEGPQVVPISDMDWVGWEYISVATGTIPREITTGKSRGATDVKGGLWGKD